MLARLQSVEWAIEVEVDSFSFFPRCEAVFVWCIECCPGEVCSVNVSDAVLRSDYVCALGYSIC